MKDKTLEACRGQEVPGLAPGAMVGMMPANCGRKTATFMTSCASTFTPVLVSETMHLSEEGKNAVLSSSGWWFLATPLKHMSSSIGMMNETQY